MMKGYVSAAFVVCLAAGAFGQNLKSSVFVTGLSLPLGMVQDPTDPNRQYVLQQRGLIRIIQNGVLQGTNAVSLVGVVSSSGSEKGLLGMAFAPDYATSGTVYVSYTTGTATTDTFLAKLKRNTINPALFDIGTLDPIFTLNQPFTNHNGGTIRFGPDGFLYFGLGDGGSAGDPGDRAQNINNLLGKMLRIDPSTDAFPPNDNKDYAIPPGQPFNPGIGALAPEIWSVGMRNPWKFSFDPAGFLGTNGLYIADVGQNEREEVNYEPPASGPRNYAWRRREGFAPFTASAGPWTFNQEPIWDYNHTIGASITGGYMYRGLTTTDSFGRYFFADHVTSKVFSMLVTFNGAGEALTVPTGNHTEVTADLALGASGISSIDVDSNGELYFVDYGNGRILRMEPENRAWPVVINYEAAYQMSGQIRSLAAADNKSLFYAANFSTDSFDGDAGVIKVGFSHNRAAPTSLQVTIVARTNQSTGIQSRMCLRNWNTRRLDFIQNMNLTTTNQTFNSTAIPSANYIRPGDGRIEVAIQGTAPIVMMDPVGTFVDQMRVAVN